MKRGNIWTIGYLGLIFISSILILPACLNSSDIINNSENASDSLTKTANSKNFEPIDIPTDEKRLALVIGNSKYTQVPALANPKNDAMDMTNTLRRIGFEVDLAIDADQANMQSSLTEFAKKLPDADVALFFYAGHGVQAKGKNYLLPVNTPSHITEVSIDDHTIRLNAILQRMENYSEDRPRTNLIFLDACRNNPLENIKTTGLSRSLGRTSNNTRNFLSFSGSPKKQGGTLIAYSTDPDNVALDGEGQDNSPFTTALTQHLVERGVDIQTILTKVRQNVLESTDNQQRPWENSSLIDKYYLVPEKEIPNTGNF